MNRALILGLLIAACVASALRCPELDARPMHNDEAVNAVKFGQLWERGSYKYDPKEYHGPTLFYATLAVAQLTTTPNFERLTEIKLRLITVAFGVGLVMWLPLIANGLGRNAAIWAGLFTAVSPAMVFYSRYYIHEMLLVFFSFLALGAGWRYWRVRRPIWAVIAGAGIGLMGATKETFGLSLAAAGVGLGLNYIWNRWVDASQPQVRARDANVRHLVAALASASVVWVVLFTSFFGNWAGLLDSVRAIGPSLNRAEGASPHIHPWSFYFHRLLCFHAHKGPVWSEAVILALAVAGAWTAFARKGLADADASFVRFLALYALALSTAYSLIPYKTPWCLLNFWQPMILLAGVGAVSLIRSSVRLVWRIAAVSFLLAGAAHLAWQAWEAAVPYAADPRNPYVYAQTSPDLLELVGKLEALSQTNPPESQMLIKVMAPENDYWPLPWYLRGFRHVGWYAAMPPDPYPPVMVVSSQFHAGLDEKKTHVMAGIFQLRPRIFLELYVQADLWRAYLEKRS